MTASSIHSFNPSVNFKGTAVDSNPALSVFDLDLSFQEAFQKLDVKGAKDLLEKGANANQEITISYPIIMEFLKIHVFGFSAQDNKKMDWDSLCKVIQKQASVEDFVNDFFGGKSSMPALTLSLLLKKSELALDLLQFGASIHTDATNALQMAVALEDKQVVEYLLQNTSLSVAQAETGKDFTPFEMALAINSYEIFELMVTERTEEVLEILVNKPELRQILATSQNPELQRYTAFLAEKGIPVA